MEALPPSIILAAYAEALVDGRRVVVFGDATSAVAAELVERGARNVHVYDREPSRAALAAGQNRSKQISITPHDDVDVAVRDGAFDVALVEDLSSFDDPARLLKQVRRALSSRGAAIVASPNPDAKLALLPRTSGGPSSTLGYYELYDAVSAEFVEVRMLGQTPFVGYAVVDFAPEGEPEVSIDSSLLPGGAEEPEWFVALAAREPLDCDPVGIVQLPARAVTGGVDANVSADLRASRATEARLLERVAELEVEVAGLRKERSEDGAAADRASRLERELREREAQVAELEARAAAADARDARARDELSALRETAAGNDAARKELQNLAAEATRAEIEKTELRERLAMLSADMTDLEAQRTDLSATKDRLEAALAEQRARAAELEQRLSEKESRISELVAEAAGAPDDLTALESALMERGENIQRLTGELRESERVGRELLRELGQARGAAAAAEPLSEENARLKANLEALTWAVEELEGRLSPPAAEAR